MKLENVKVQAVKQRDTNFSILIEKDWYGGFGTCPYEKGMTVSFEWEQEGQWRNIKGDLTEEVDADKQYNVVPIGDKKDFVENLIKAKQEKPSQAYWEEKDRKINNLAVKKITAMVYQKPEFSNMSFAEICKIVDETQWQKEDK